MASPLIVKTQIGDSFAKEYSDRIQCLDPINGQVMWNIGQDAINITDPTTSDNVAYFGTVAGVMEAKLYAVKVETGEPIWECDMTRTSVISRPCITNDWVIFGCTGGKVSAIDKESGEVELEFYSEWKQAIINQIFVFDDRFVACSYTGQFFSGFLSHNEVIWESELPDDDFYRIMDKGKVNMIGRFIVAAIQERWLKGDTIVWEEDMELTHELWVIDSDDGQITGPFGPYDDGAIFITEDYIYSLIKSETLENVGLNSATLQVREWDHNQGQFISREETLIPNISELSDILVGGNKLFGCDFDNLYAFDLVKNAMSWIKQDNLLASGSPIQLIDDLLFVTAPSDMGDDLACLNTSTGRLLWNCPNILDVATSP